MEMITHQPNAMHLPFGLGSGFGQGGEKALATSVIPVYFLPPVAAARSRILSELITPVPP